MRIEAVEAIREEAKDIAGYAIILATYVQQLCDDMPVSHADFEEFTRYTTIEVAALLKERNKAYAGDSEDALETFRFQGVMQILSRIYEKVCRAKSLALNNPGVGNASEDTGEESPESV